MIGGDSAAQRAHHHRLHDWQRRFPSYGHGQLEPINLTSALSSRRPFLANTLRGRTTIARAHTHMHTRTRTHARMYLSICRQRRKNVQRERWTDVSLRRKLNVYRVLVSLIISEREISRTHSHTRVYHELVSLTRRILEWEQRVSRCVRSQNWYSEYERRRESD